MAAFFLCSWIFFSFFRWISDFPPLRCWHFYVWNQLIPSEHFQSVESCLWFWELISLNIHFFWDNCCIDARNLVFFSHTSKLLLTILISVFLYFLLSVRTHGLSLSVISVLPILPFDWSIGFFLLFMDYIFNIHNL